MTCEVLKKSIITKFGCFVCFTADLIVQDYSAEV